jgi:hypothetical protein
MAIKKLTKDMLDKVVADIKSKRGILHISWRYIQIIPGYPPVYFSLCGLHSDFHKFDMAGTNEAAECKKCIAAQAKLEADSDAD